MKTIIFITISAMMFSTSFASGPLRGPVSVSLSQVQIDVRIIEVDADNDVVFSIPFTNEQLLENLKTRKNIEVLSTQRLTTHTGESASIRSVTEYIYPSEFKIDVISSDLSYYIVPASFVTREVGVIINITPEFRYVESTNPTNIIALANGNIIYFPIDSVDFESMAKIVIQASIQIVDEPDWKDYGAMLADNIGKAHIFPTDQPFFPVREINTRFNMPNGSTIVLGGMTKEVKEIKDTRTPFLWRISKIFGEKKEITKKRELYIILTATASEFPEK